MNRTFRYVSSMALLLLAMLVPGVAWGETVVVGPHDAEAPDVSVKIKRHDSAEWVQGIEAFCNQKVDVQVSVVLPRDVGEYSSFPLDIEATETMLAHVDPDSLEVSVDGADVTRKLFDDGLGLVFGDNAGDRIRYRMSGDELPGYPVGPGSGDKPWQLDGMVGVSNVDEFDVRVGLYDITGLSGAKAGSVVEVRFTAEVESYGRLDEADGGWKAWCTYPHTKDGEGNVHAYSDVVARCGCCRVSVRGCEHDAYYSAKLLRTGLMKWAPEMYMLSDGRLFVSSAEIETFDAGRFSVKGVCSGVYSFERVDAPGGKFQLSVALEIDEGTGELVALSAEVIDGDAKVENVDVEGRLVTVNLGRDSAAPSSGVAAASADAPSADEGAGGDSRAEATARDEGFDVGGVLVVLLAIAFTAIALLVRRISRVSKLMKGGFR